jgi:hypothetical protein
MRQGGESEYDSFTASVCSTRVASCALAGLRDEWRSKWEREDKGKGAVAVLNPVILRIAELDRLVAQHRIREKAKLLQTIDIDFASSANWSRLY